VNILLRVATAEGKTTETKYFYTGLGRINLHTRTFQLLRKTGDTFLLTEHSLDIGVLSRVYNVENVTYTEYSETPRRWCERTDPHTAFYFEEVRRIVPEKVSSSQWTSGKRSGLRSHPSVSSWFFTWLSFCWCVGCTLRP
jgi:hypothetical protein